MDRKQRESGRNLGSGISFNGTSLETCYNEAPPKVSTASLNIVTSRRAWGASQITAAVCTACPRKSKVTSPFVLTLL